jgi:hypothetical protein
MGSSMVGLRSSGSGFATTCVVLENVASFAPFGLGSQIRIHPRLTPWIAIFRRFAGFHWFDSQPILALICKKSLESTLAVAKM